MDDIFHVDAEPGQLWELSSWWANVFATDGRTFLLLRKIGDTAVWQTLCIETSAAETITLSSLLYDRVV